MCWDSEHPGVRGCSQETGSCRSRAVTTALCHIAPHVAPRLSWIHWQGLSASRPFFDLVRDYVIMDRGRWPYPGVQSLPTELDSEVLDARARCQYHGVGCRPPSHISSGYSLDHHQESAPHACT